MQNVSSIGKRALTTAVAAATMLWSVGFSSFVAPLSARAAVAGDLVKGQTLSTVYYYANDGKRYAFPNEKTYFSWYSDFSGTQTISDSQLAAIPLGGNIVGRPGSFWVKIQSDPKTYAVTPDGGLRWIETEAVAVGLAGSDWNQFIVDVPDVFFADYTVGASLTSAAAAYNGALVKSGTSNYLVWNGQKRMVTSAGFSGNRFQSRFLLDGSGVNLSAITAGADVTGQEATLWNPAQLAASAATTGGLSVSLASDTPAAMTIPSKATSVPFLKFNLSASSGSATVSAVTIKQSGVGATTTVSNVYLYDGSTRLTSGRTLNSSTREATFSGLGISLAAGQTKTLTVVVDMADNATGGDTIQYSVQNAAAIQGSATVSGVFPVTGATMTTSSTNVGSLTVNKSGTIVQPVLGSKQSKIAEFKLTTATEGAAVNQIRLDIRDASKHNNFTLYQNNVLVAAGTKSGTDKVDFLFTKPFDIAQGENRIFEVRADIGGESNDEILTAIDETTDVKAVGSKYGFNVAVVINDTTTGYDKDGSANCNSAADACSFTTVKGGKVTIAFNGPTASKVKPSTTGVSLWDGTITSQNAITVRELQFDIAGTNLIGTANNYQSFRLVNTTTGAVISGPYEFDAGVNGTVGAVTMTDDWNMSAGESIDVSLLVDVKGTTGDYDVASGDTITATYDASTFSARDSNNQDLSLTTDVVPGSTDLGGFAQTITTSSLAVALSQPPSSSTYVKGTQNVDMLGVSFIAGSATAVKVTAVTFAATGSNTDIDAMNLDPNTYISSCSIYDGGTGALINGPQSFASWTTGTVTNITFSNFTWNIPAGETGKMIARCNFANVATGSSNDDFWTLEINDNADVTALDGSGDSIATVDGATSVNEDTQTVKITITSSGTLAVTADGSTPKSAILLGSSTAVPVATYKFAATTEDFLVKTLSLGNCLSANNIGTATSAGCNATVQPQTTFDNTTGGADVFTLVVGSSTATITESASTSAAGAALADITFSCATNAVTCGTSLKTAINTNTLLSALVYATVNDTTGLVTITQVDSSALTLALTVASPTYYVVLTPSTNMGKDNIASAVKISYQDAAGATQTKSGTFSGGKVKFSDLNFKVSTGSTKTVTVTVDTNAVSSTGASSGSRMVANFIPADFEATGVSSGASLNYDDVSQAVGNPMVARKTKPTISLASGSPSGAGIPSLSEVFRFNVSADSRGFVKLNQIMFKVSTTDNNGAVSGPDWNECDTDTAGTLASAAKWDLFNASDLSAALDDGTFAAPGDWSWATGTTGAACDTTADVSMGYAILNFLGSTTTGAEEIGAGSTKTYLLRVDTSGASAANDDSIRIDIPDQVETNGLTTTKRNAIRWEDDVETNADGAQTSDVTPTSAAVSTNTAGTSPNGALVKNLPVIGGTIVY